MSATFEEAIQPLMDAYAALEADVTEREAELADLREKRNRLKSAVRALDPERFPAAGKAPKPKKKYSQHAVDYVTSFLLGHIDGEFGSADIFRHPDYLGVKKATLPAILRELHEKGFLRLVRTGKGNSRYYEVIR